MSKKTLMVALALVVFGLGFLSIGLLFNNVTDGIFNLLSLPSLPKEVFAILPDEFRDFFISIFFVGLGATVFTLVLHDH